MFRRLADIQHVHAGGRVIRTTLEHPFYEARRGWVPVKELAPGDRIRTDTGWVTVEEVYDTGEWEVVYNLRVADHHTYFVGDDDWGWAAWAHNQYTPVNTFSAGRVFSFTFPNSAYSGLWYVPKDKKFMTARDNPNQKVQNAIAKDAQPPRPGDMVQKAVDLFAATWDALAWDDPQKATRDQRAAIEKFLNPTDGINWIYQQVGMSTVSYQDYMSGTPLPLLPPTKPAALNMTDAQYDDLKKQHGELLRLANAQRAAAKGYYVHTLKLKAWAPAHGFEYQDTGIDLKHLATGLQFEVMVKGAWDQHSGPSFQTNFWRAITY